MAFIVYPYSRLVGSRHYIQCTDSVDLCMSSVGLMLLLLRLLLLTVSTSRLSV